jgi:hypothetical protein
MPTILGGWSANRKLSGFHGGISPAKSAYRKVTHYRQFILGKRGTHPALKSAKDEARGTRLRI